MAGPTNREEFKQYCLRKLGAPVIEINVADEQLEDRIDEALKFWNDYHYDGTSKSYYSHQVTQQDIDNKYITLPENIIGAVSIFDLGTHISSNSMFDIRYQIALNDLYALTSTSLVPYYMTMQHIQMLEQILVGKQPIRYNRHRNQLHIDTKWSSRIVVGQYIVVEAYEIIDPETYSDVWSDRWLQKYATALIKRQWGSNLTKFIGMTLPGGVQFNGEKILNDSESEIQKLEQDLIYQDVLLDWVG
jgi:hypothetical protein